MSGSDDIAVSPQLDWFEEYADRHQADAERTIATIPGLSLAVQAFLFSIGLGPSTSGAGRIAVAIVGLVSAFVTYAVTRRQERRRVTYAQALHEHRLHRGAESVTYDALRERYGPTRRTYVSTVSIWLGMVTVFVLLDIFVFVAGVLEVTGVTDILAG